MSVHKPLTNKEINLFSIGLSPFMMLMGPVGAYFAYFLTDIVKMSAAVVGGLLLLTRIADTVSIVLVGAIIENKSKMGQILFLDLYWCSAYAYIYFFIVYQSFFHE